MFLGKENICCFFRISVQDLADLIECLSGYDHFPVIIHFLELGFSHRDPVPVQSNHTDMMINDLHQFTGHHSIALVGRNGENRLGDHIAQRILRETDSDRAVYFGKEFKIRAVSSENGKLCVLTVDQNLFAICLDGNIIVGKLTDDVKKDLRVNSDHSSFENDTLGNSLDSQFRMH